MIPARNIPELPPRIKERVQGRKKVLFSRLHKKHGDFNQNRMLT